MLEPTYLTLVNVSDIARNARLDSVGSPGASRFEFLAPFGVRTLELDEPFEPSIYRLTCTGCADVDFGLAFGQRLIVFVVDRGDPLAARTDIRVVNESGVRQIGALRTGAVIGEGRTVISFDLGDGEEASIGIRLSPGLLIDLNVTCGACLPQLIRIGNGADLEVPLR